MPGGVRKFQHGHLEALEHQILRFEVRNVQEETICKRITESA